ncbi:MAG: acetyl-CoA carboxylase biotin carboxyl carrier protein [Bacteroidales bacterium]|nr:acetyl-CoA carboxylase biotin carboxyl carrier protein [Bacteroidales bacterium]
MNYSELQDFIKAVAKSGATEVKIESEGLNITIKTAPKGKTTETIVQQIPVAAQIPQAMQAPQTMVTQVAPQAPLTVSEAPAAPAKDNDESKYITIKAPMVGTFYRKPSPDKPVFVNVGDTVAPGKVICILEAMKLFNEIESEVSGTIVKVLVDDASPVEYDQPLYLVDPS